jgi:serine-type D-Ala-D-Ala carboxypeptidase/endopeptidase (penicillin-binding protein 4)
MANVQVSIGKTLLVVSCWLLAAGISAQTVSQKLQKAFQQFENDDQLKHAISSLYVVDAKTGQVVFDKNAQIGLAPASTQKVITSVTAFELLGKNFRYKTEFYYRRGLHIINDKHFGFVPSGDPTFGSSRFESTKPEIVISKIHGAFRTIYLDNKSDSEHFNYRVHKKEIPKGWIWEDLGNYYGAASQNLNWMENKYEITFSSSEVGSEAKIIEVTPINPGIVFENKVIAGEKGSGDNAYIYFSLGTDTVIIKGTIPPNQTRFTISGAMYNPENFFFSQLKNYFSDTKRVIASKLVPNLYRSFGPISDEVKSLLSIGPSDVQKLFTHYSPSLDSIIYWFNKKSINLYGEALIKTLAYEKQGLGSTDSGVAIVKKFWKQKGLDEDELNIYDGSGLSPLNRVTTHAQVEILKYAKTKDWFPYFLKSLPDYNGMTMKSGTISDVKGFCGYHKAKDGKEYIFSFLVNNYSGKTSGLVGKMYKVLDELK